jgi:electron transfer flavoprotein beta subunit
MKELNIIVCIKQVPDPEGPSSAFEVDSATKKVHPVGITPVINPFDQNALEAALQLRDNYGGNIVAISMLEGPATPVLKKALSVGANQLILLQDEHFRDLNCSSTAYVLSAAIRKFEPYDLILVGRQAADWDFGQVGSIIAEILQVPCISLATKVEIEDHKKVVVKKLRRNGYEVIKAPMPALITVSSEIGDLRIPLLKDIKEAYKKPSTSWNISSLNIDSQRLEARKIYTLLPPPSKKRECFIVGGDSPQEKGEKLALQLRHDKVI